MTVRGRLWLGFVAILVAGVGALAILGAGLRGVHQKFRTSVERQAPAAAAAHELAISVIDTTFNARRFADTGQPEYREGFEFHSRNSREAIARYRSLIDEDGDLRAIDAFEPRFDELLETSRRLIDRTYILSEKRDRIREKLSEIADVLAHGSVADPAVVRVPATSMVDWLGRWVVSLRDESKRGRADEVAPGGLRRLRTVLQVAFGESPERKSDWYRKADTLLSEATSLQREISSVDSRQQEDIENLVRLRFELEREVRERWMARSNRRLEAASRSADEHAARTARASVVAIPLFLLACVVVGRTTVKAALGPIEKLIQGTRALEEGDLSFRFEVNSRDELGTVLRRFNAMAGQIQRGEHELRSVNMQLVNEVAQCQEVECALRRAEARKRALLQAIPDHMLVLDGDGRIVDWDTGEYDLAPRDANPSQPGPRGDADRAVDALSEQLRQLVSVEAKKALASGHPRTVEHRIETARGIRDVEIRLRVIGEDECLAMIRDMTEAREVDRLKSEFVSTVSHELRTPLTSVRGSLGLLEAGVAGEIPEQALELVRIARSNTERLIRLVNDMLDLEKIEAGRLELHREPLSADELVEEAVEGLKGASSLVDVRIERVAVPTDVLAGDRDRLIQVLTNLLSNALKYSPAGGTILLSAGPATRPNHVRFSVTDDGPGISPEQRPRLFGRFQQLDSSDTRAKGGTGLGLAISRGIVELHDGVIDVDSEPGKGATFWFEIPLASARHRASPPTGRTEPHRVLVVEDDPDLARLLDGSLQRNGFRVERAPSVVAAREYLARMRPDVIILDLELPDGTGLGLIDELSLDERTSSIPVVVTTGTHEQSHTPVADMVFDWLAKPFSVPRLVRTLRRAVREPGKARVLVVENDETLRATAVGCLEKLGAECHTASNGADAVDIARRVSPDLIVLNGGSSETDGLALVDALRWDRLRSTPMIVYSKNKPGADEHRILSLGTTRHLSNSQCSEEDFIAAVRELLEGVLPESSEAA